MPRPVTNPDPTFGPRLRDLRERAGMSLRHLAAVAHYSRTYLWELETGRKSPGPEVAAALDAVLKTDGELAALVTPAALPDAPMEGLDEIDALELARRVAATDIGEETISRLELVVDTLATSYSITPPIDLLARTRRHLSYTSALLDAGTRKTLREHKRLIVVSAWLSLLAATLHIDLKQHAAAAARLATAASLAQEAGHSEIHAWTYETRAWSALTNGRYRQAIEISQAAQHLAPEGSSAQIQATAQEGRAWARIGGQEETYDALNRVAHLVSGLARPDRPEHHYRYDPDKAVAYVATTLAWLGDPAAEPYAREVIAKLKAAEDAGGWPRRVAAAQIDLGLALVVAGKPDEAAASAQAAILSGRIVPSNYWRALEVVSAVEETGLPEASELREAYETLRRGGIAPPPPRRAVLELGTTPSAG